MDIHSAHYVHAHNVLAGEVGELLVVIDFHLDHTMKHIQLSNQVVYVLLIVWSK